MRRPEVVNQISQAIRRVAPTATAILYGSEARGDAREDSDIDLLILLDGDKRDLKHEDELAGVGRKTANVVLSVVWGEARMAVDTHVFRVSHRIGLVPDSCTTPLSVEQMLTRYFTEEEIPDAHHWLILHGRYVCTALHPKCDECGISHLCKTYKVKRKE